MSTLELLQQNQALKLHSEERLIMMLDCYQYQLRKRYSGLQPSARKILQQKCREIQANLDSRSNHPIAA